MTAQGIMFSALFMVVVLLIYLVFWIFALVAVLEAKKADSWKLNWLIVVIFVPLIGLILWWAIGLLQRKQ